MHLTQAKSQFLYLLYLLKLLWGYIYLCKSYMNKSHKLYNSYSNSKLNNLLKVPRYKEQCKYLILLHSLKLFDCGNTRELFITMASIGPLKNSILQEKQPLAHFSLAHWPWIFHTSRSEKLGRSESGGLWWAMSFPNRTGKRVLEGKWSKSTASPFSQCKSLQLPIHLGLGSELRVSGSSWLLN